VTLDPSKLLAAIPIGLRDPLLEEYRMIASNYAEHRWGPSELTGGRFSEVVHTILDGAVSGTFAVAPAKPSNMRNACLDLENKPNTGKPGDRSIRVLIPRALLTLYEVRNNRNVGHVGGDVDPNMMDATVVFALASWVLAELIRIYHAVSTAEAQEAVDALSERKLPLVWSPDGKLKRVLDTKLKGTHQTLLILHQSVGWVAEADLVKSVEYSNPAMFRSNVLQRAHKARLIEYDKEAKRARISPKGSAHVEKDIVAPRMGWKTAP
jgi:hypothetical protein